jgi:folate-binding protein YgfZ
VTDDPLPGGAHAEYEALTERVGLVDEPDRVVIEVTGDRARGMIDGLVTNALGPIVEGMSVYAFMLTPKGRAVAEMRITPGVTSSEETARPESSGDVWLDAPTACAESLLAHLGKYVPPLYARFATTDMARLSVVGPLASRAAESISDTEGWRIEAPSPGELEDLQAVRVHSSGTGSEDPVGAPLLLVRREAVEGPGFDLYVPASAVLSVRAALRETVQALGGLPVSRAVWEILRVERGVPVYGREITADSLPQETGQAARAVHFDKGCYTGQEVVARIHYRGHVNRRLVGFLSGDPAESFAPDSPLFLGERSVAETRTAVISPRFGAIALGYARREVEPGQALSREAGAPADVQVRALPFTLT